MSCKECAKLKEEVCSLKNKVESLQKVVDRYLSRTASQAKVTYLEGK